MTATVAVSLPYPDDAEMVPRTDTRLTFWREFRQRIPERSREDIGDNLESFIRQQEERLRSRFPNSLENYLNRNIGWFRQFPQERGYGGNVTVIVKHISYGSLLFDLDIITAPLVALGLTADDVLKLLERYTPEAIDDSLQSVPSLDVKVTGDVTKADDPLPSTTPSTSSPPTMIVPANSRLDKILNIANTSLVVVSAVLLLAAFLLFQSAAAERDRLTTALIQERSEIAAQREKLLDRYGTQLKGLEDHLSAETKHFTDLYEVEAGILKERLKQIKSQ